MMAEMNSPLDSDDSDMLLGNLETMCVVKHCERIRHKIKTVAQIVLESCTLRRGLTQS